MTMDLALIVGQIDARLKNMESRLDRHEQTVEARLGQVNQRLRDIDRRMNTWGGGLTAIGAVLGAAVTVAVGWLGSLWLK